jgi:hypothetical protein
MAARLNLIPPNDYVSYLVGFPDTKVQHSDTDDSLAIALRFRKPLIS